ncbi:MAG: DJ-1 family glyoxalase III [Peptoniphilaceae bacterium]|nr:DJ-1/PfpI family protein [Peptoniphilaceae bacterium]MDD7382786.1 DJ-1/PfpI family protein [Peptoniphilaceae bacterium]MDY3737942.1 DJ-1 family glyoxalase III [Peptoniphilaceae bacterium]
MKAVVFLAEGFEEIEALTPVDYLRRAEIEVDTVSITNEKIVKGSHLIPVVADKLIKDINPCNYDLCYIPGGMPAAKTLKENDDVIEFIKEMNDEEKLIASICAGPIVLNRAGVLKNKKATSFPGFEDQLDNIGEYIDNKSLVKDGNIITSRGPAVAIYEALDIVEMLKGRESKEKLLKEIQQDKVEKDYNFKTK